MKSFSSHQSKFHINIDGRYERFNMFVRGGEDEYNKYSPAPSIEASEVTVREDGSVGFTNGRHRYAWMRDNGINNIPVVMDR